MTPFEYARARGIKQIRLVIYQPKVYDNGSREWTCSLDDLEAFVALARSKANSVRVAEESHGKIPIAEWNKTFLHPNPNEEDCAFCKAMAICPAARGKLEATVGDAFDVVVVENKTCADPDAYDNSTIGEKMAAVGFIEDWCKAVRAEVERRLLLDQEVPGWGLELGRQGPRKWKDPEEATRVLREQFRLKLEDAFKLKVKSPTQVEEMTKVPKGTDKPPLVGERQWKKLQPMITRSDPKPSVKSADVITKPFKPVAPDASDFSAVGDASDLI